MASPDISFLSIIIVTIISIILGALWYSPLLFGNIWVKLMGFSKKDIEKGKKKGMTMKYTIMSITSLIMIYVLAHFVDYTDSITFLKGMQTGFWIWLGFLATTMLGTVLWEGKSFKLYLINTSYYFVLLIFAGGILAVWV